MDRKLVYAVAVATLVGCSNKDRGSSSSASSGVAPTSSLLFQNGVTQGSGSAPGTIGVASGVTTTNTPSGSATNPSFAPGQVTPIGGGTGTTTDPYANVGSRFWHVNDTLGQPLETHTAAQTTLAGQVVDAINAERQKQGLPALRIEGVATRTAKAQSEDMLGRGYFDHITPEGWTPSQRYTMLGGAGARKVAENLIKGAGDAQAIVSAWMASPGHRANILDADVNEVGVGVASSDPYVTALFVQR